MVLKSLVRETIGNVLEEHDVEDGDLAEDLLDRLCTIVEVYDDEEGEDFLGEGE